MSDDFSDLKPIIFKLDDREWEEFCGVLDREPVYMPKMKAFLAKPSVFIAEDD